MDMKHKWDAPIWGIHIQFGMPQTDVFGRSWSPGFSREIVGFFRELLMCNGALINFVCYGQEMKIHIQYAYMMGRDRDKERNRDTDLELEVFTVSCKSYF